MARCPDWLRHTTLTWVERHHDKPDTATPTYLHDIATALATLTGEPHPFPAPPTSTQSTRRCAQLTDARRSTAPTRPSPDPPPAHATAAPTAHAPHSDARPATTNTYP
jgi:hypothetical protein